MRQFRVFILLSAACALLVAACGGDSASSSSIDDVTVTGEFGEKPTLDIPDGEPSEELETAVLAEGDGQEVGTDDFVVVNYLGQTWAERDGEDYVFDNSYDRGTVAGFSLNMVVPGWKEGLTGQQVGSRVLVSIPPELGYGGGPEGAASEHDLAEDTLVFVVDIVDAVAPDAAAGGTPVDGLPDGLPVVEGGETGPPSVDFAGAEEPEETDATVVLAGDGGELGETVLVQMLEAPYPDGEGTQSTWELQGPEQVPAEGLQTLPGWEEIVGEVTVGSRVLTRISAEDAAIEGAEDAETPALLLVIDVLASY